jgi:hypothetical protein
VLFGKVAERNSFAAAFEKCLHNKIHGGSLHDCAQTSTNSPLQMCEYLATLENGKSAGEYYEEVGELPRGRRRESARAKRNLNKFPCCEDRGDGHKTKNAYENGCIPVRSPRHREFDFGCALILISCLPDDLDGRRLGHDCIEKVDALMRKVVICESQPVRAGGESAHRRSKFNLNDSAASTDFSGCGKIESGNAEVQSATIKLRRKFAFQQLCVSCGFVGRNNSIAVAIHDLQKLVGNVHARRQIYVKPKLARLNRDQSRLQIFVQPMGRAS